MENIKVGQLVYTPNYGLVNVVKNVQWGKSFIVATNRNVKYTIPCEDLYENRKDYLQTKLQEYSDKLVELNSDIKKSDVLIEAATNVRNKAMLDKTSIIKLISEIEEQQDLLEKE